MARPVAWRDAESSHLRGLALEGGDPGGRGSNGRADARLETGLTVGSGTGYGSRERDHGARRSASRPRAHSLRWHGGMASPKVGGAGVCMNECGWVLALERGVRGWAWPVSNTTSPRW